MLSRIMSLLSPQLDWMQVDASSCGLEPGPYSIRRVCKDAWRERHMSPEVMLRVAPYLHRVKMVHFQGWGEPLANPRLFELAAAARRAGCKMTTSVHDPAVLRESALENLIRMPFASVTVNVASLDEELHAQRRGTDLEGIKRKVSRLAALKKEYGSPLPRIMVLYTLFRSSMDELERLPGVFAPLGVQTLLVNPLAAVPLREQVVETVVPSSQEEFDTLSRRLEAVDREAAGKGMGFHYFLLHGGRQQRGCIENVQRALFVGAEGEVSPCIFSQMPGGGEARYFFQNMALPLPHCVFGNVRSTLLRHIWHQPDYRAFRKSFNKERLPECCMHCWRPYIVAR